ncbi:MAG: SHOCT-like domain-containing protein [Sphaerochaetaceae bacterium]|jgi:hypothetical protein
MSEERLRILQLLSEGKLTPEQAEKLLQATEVRSEIIPTTSFTAGDAKYFHVRVEPKEGHSSERVSIKIPLALVKAGLNITKLVPKEAQAKIQESMHNSGMNFDLSALNAENMEEVIVALQEMSIDVETDEATIKVFCA